MHFNLRDVDAAWCVKHHFSRNLWFFDCTEQFNWRQRSGFDVAIWCHSPDVHRFLKNPAATSKFCAGDGAMKHVPYSRPTNIRCHHTKFSRPGFGYPYRNLFCCIMALSSHDVAAVIISPLFHLFSTEIIHSLLWGMSWLAIIDLP
jgi:hypothetical protein